MFPVGPPPKKKMCFNKRNTEPQTLMDLPMDILVDILMRLQPAIESLSQFRCVSKTALNFIDSPFFAQLHTSRLLNSAASGAAIVQLPQHILLTEFGTRDVVKHQIGLHPIKYTTGAGHDNASVIVFKHARPDWKIFCGGCPYDVHFVFCNLIGFKARKLTSSCFLFDALRGEVLQLPLMWRNRSPFNMGSNMGSDITFTWYGMGFDNLSCTYKIVCVSTWCRHADLEAHVYTLGASATTSSWRQIHSVPPRVLSNKNVSAYGDMHWFIDPYQPQRSCSYDADSCIISFDFKKEEFVWTPNPNLPGFVNNFRAMHLLNLRRSLAIVDFSDHDRYGGYEGERYVDIWVLKDYSKKKKEWTMDYKIETPIIVTSLRSAIGEWEHGIFYTCFPLPNCYFLDLRNKSTECIQWEALFRSLSSYNYNYWSGEKKTKMIMYSYTKSLISLRNYGNLLEREKACKWAVFEAAKTNATRFFETAKTSPWGIFEAAKTNARAFSEATKTSMWHFETLC